MQLELCRNEVSKTKILYNNLSTVKLVQFLSFSVAARLAFCVRVYVRPLAVLGSTKVRTSPTGIFKTSGVGGYLNEREGP